MTPVPWTDIRAPDRDAGEENLDRPDPRPHHPSAEAGCPARYRSAPCPDSGSDDSPCRDSRRARASPPPAHREALYSPPPRRAVSDGARPAPHRPCSAPAQPSTEERLTDLARLLDDGGDATWRRAAVPHPFPVTMEVLERYYEHREGALQRDHELLLWASEGGPSEDMDEGLHGIRACSDGWAKRFVKVHSALNEVFFRPPLAHYDESLSDLVFIPTDTVPHVQGLPDWLPALWIPHSRARGVVVVCHGNACDIQENPSVRCYNRLCQMSVLALEWPGYGLAYGYPTEENLVSSVLAAVLFCRRYLRTETHRVVLVGRSLATGPCVKAAALLEERGHRVGGLILKSAYTSWKGILRTQGEPGTCMRLLGRAAAAFFFDRFRTIDTLPVVRCPALLIHGGRDPVVPVEHAHALYRASCAAGGSEEDGGKKLVVSADGCHDHGLEAWLDVTNFVGRLGLPSLPLPTRMPEECYDVAAHAERSRRWKACQRRRRTFLPVFIAVCGCGTAAFAAVATLRDACRGSVVVWLWMHSAVLVAAAIIRAFADWTRDDLERAQSTCIVASGVSMLVLLALGWLGDMSYGHYALWRDGWGGGSDCDEAYWIGAFGTMIGTNYVYALQCALTNK